MLSMPLAMLMRFKAFTSKASFHTKLRKTAIICTYFHSRSKHEGA